MSSSCPRVDVVKEEWGRTVKAELILWPVFRALCCFSFQRLPPLEVSGFLALSRRHEEGLGRTPFTATSAVSWRQ